MPRHRTDAAVAATSWHSALPTFESREALQAAPEWSQYLDRVYGASTLIFPLDLKRFGFFYTDAPVAMHHAELPLLGRTSRGKAKYFNDPMRSAFEALLRVGTRRTHLLNFTGRRHREAYSLYPSPPYSEFAQSIVWVYLWPPAAAPDGSVADGGADVSAVAPRFPGVGGFPSSSRVEVFHCAEDVPQSEYWMYYAPGSGIYLDLGKTFAARSRCELWRKLDLDLDVSMRGKKTGARCTARRGFNGTRPGTLSFGGMPPSFCPGFWCGTRGELMHQGHIFTRTAMRLLKARGYDSLQLTHHEEHGIYKYEIVDLRQQVPHLSSGLRPGAPVRLPPASACPKWPPPGGMDLTGGGGGSASSAGEAGPPYFRGWGGQLRCNCGTPSPVSAAGDGSCMSCV